MSALIETPLAELLRLHGEIAEAARTSLDKAIRCGEILAGQKASVAHGKWLPWVKENLPFTDRTARNYIRVFEHRDAIKSESLSDLTAAYAMLAAPKAQEPAPTRLAELEAVIEANLPTANSVMDAMDELENCSQMLKRELLSMKGLGL